MNERLFAANPYGTTASAFDALNDTAYQHIKNTSTLEKAVMKGPEAASRMVSTMQKHGDKVNLLVFDQIKKKHKN